jgi:Predicted metal-dependent hydrolase of the TIM-barrel fold
MIINAHAHIFPDGIAEKATAGISDFYKLPMDSSAGTVGNLFADGEAAGVDKYVVCSVATVPRQTRVINEFMAKVCAEHADKLVFLAAAHPDTENVVSEIEYAVSLGAKGVKLHPDFQTFKADHKAAFPIYEYCEAAGLPLLIHAGDSRFDFTSPRRILNIKKMYPNLTLVAAHMGGWSEWDEAKVLLPGSGIYVDTCSTQGFITPEQMAEMIAAYGTDHVLFGTDFPMWNACKELLMLKQLGLSDDDMGQILHGNAEKLFF